MLIRIFLRWNRSLILGIICFFAIGLLFIPAIASAQTPVTSTEEGETGQEPSELTSEEQPADQQEGIKEEVTEKKTETEKTSWLGFLVKGGLTMIPIALCSIGFIAIVAVKFPIFRLMRFSINSFAEALRGDVSSGNIDEAIAKCEAANNSITRPLKKGLMVHKENPARTEDTLREAMLDEMPGLEAHIGWLGIIAGVAPLLGLFGTVIGIIQAFIELAAGGAVSDPNSFKLLADGIYKALITTAAGLFVGIPALVMYEYFRMKVSDLMRDMDRISVSLLNALGITLGGGR